MQTFFFILLIFWYIGFGLLLFYLYLVHSRPYDTQFTESYYQKIPSLLKPSELSILLYRKITPDVFTATILFLIDQRILLVQKDCDYVLTLNHEYKDSLSQGESYTIDILLDIIGDGSKVRLSEIYHFCDDKRNTSEFLLNYQLWKKIISKEANGMHFFESKWNYSKVQFYKYVGILLFVFNILFSYHFVIGYMILLAVYFLSHYFYTIYKRTMDANLEYEKWLAFKNYLIHIQQFDFDKENVRKYLMYGVVLKVSNIEKNFFSKDDGFVTVLGKSINRCIVKSYFSGNRKIFNRVK